MNNEKIQEILTRANALTEDTNINSIEFNKIAIDVECLNNNSLRERHFTLNDKKSIKREMFYEIYSCLTLDNKYFPKNNPLASMHVIEDYKDNRSLIILRNSVEYTKLAILAYLINNDEEDDFSIFHTELEVMAQRFLNAEIVVNTKNITEKVWERFQDKEFSEVYMREIECADYYDK